MHRFARASILLFAGLAAGDALASDACSTLSIRTAADVSVSDGSAFRTESFYHQPDAAAIRHIDDRVRLVAVDGPFGWAVAGDRVDVGKDFYRNFALGHQYHALVLHFDDIVGNPTAGTVEFGGRTRDAITGDNPHGGSISLISGESGTRPAGLVFRVPDAPAVEVTLSDWRPAGERELPWVVLIDDTERTFEYRYTSVDVAETTPLWFFDAVPAPDSDEVRIYRLHRRLLAAHCLGDAGTMARLSMPESVIASRGDLSVVSREEMAARFEGAFERFRYDRYVDLEPPIVAVAESGDLGWIAVNVLAAGADRVTDETFADQWSWIMTVRKQNGEWLHAGNASSLRPPMPPE